MTLQILWDEYISHCPDGYRHSCHCDLYRGWGMKLPVTMRQDHAAGDKLFVDYAGDTVTVVVDRLSGKTRQAHLFVAVLRASSLSYAQARWSETLPDWIECHALALEFTQINDHYQPTSRVRMARRHWRPNLCRCHTRQVGPQCHRVELSGDSLRRNLQRKA
ncbi:hypothetical protein EV184_13621 [Sinorhizobium americanum]|uniref:Transposase n=1 Tax=Sinorhizobium americanum TaxID=194963 RepID=A0A4R2AXP7_9HYPH|nr:hypothetical protein EV184_13621 [Sinorhizobium americanum]